MSRASRVAFVAIACAVTAACAQILDLEPPPDGAAPDSSTPDGFVPDASDGGDAAPATCAALDAALPNDDAGTTFHPFASDAIVDGGSLSIVATYNLSSLPNTPSGFEGATFDGKFLYLAPSNPGQPILQYNLAKSLSSTSAWAQFVPTSVLGAQVGFSGATFDGRYVYFVPHATAAASSGMVLRFDSMQSFVAPTSWSAFDTQTIPVADGGVPARGFSGGAFDGRFVFFVPNASTSSSPAGRVARYDTAADAGDASAFASAASWSTFDTTSVNALDTGFRGGVFDGRFVYLVPSFNAGPTSNGYSGYIARYDTTSDAGFSTGWSTFGISQKNANAVGFTGGAFDGRYVYFVPNHTTTVVRYDTTSTFSSATSYETNDLAALVVADAGTPQFAGAAFDGRFVYFAPSGASFGIALRYDTLSPFGSGCAWSTLDLTHYNALGTDYFGAIYDGRYLYFVPHGSVITRFDTKTPAWMPLSGTLPSFAGSFY